MSRILIIVSVCLLIPSSFASPDVRPITGMSGTLSYDAFTGVITPVDLRTRRMGFVIWEANQTNGSFLALSEEVLGLDWGDVADDVPVGGLGFYETTNSQAVDGDNSLILVIYGSDDGWNSQTRQILAGYFVDNIPGSTHPSNEFWGYHFLIQLREPFLLSGADLDGDDLLDFSYVYYPYTIRTPGAVMGPAISGTIDPNVVPPGGPGIVNAYDLFGRPDFENDPNLHATPYIGTYLLGGDPFAQFYWEMFSPSCPNATSANRFCSADLNYDCLVNLQDLAECLAGFSEPGSLICDCYPPDELYPGDGIVNVADLAELLSEYGYDCRGPQ